MKVRKRTIFGSVLVVGAIIGSFLSISGFGNGNGNGDSEGDDEGNSTLVSLDTSADIFPKEIVPTPSLPADVLDVRIEDRSYSVRHVANGKDVYQSSEIEQIVEMAKAAKGDDLGVRVRIYRTPTARVLAWETLERELKKAGVGEHSVQLVKGIVGE